MYKESRDPLLPQSSISCVFFYLLKHCSFLVPRSRSTHHNQNSDECSDYYVLLHFTGVLLRLLFNLDTKLFWKFQVFFVFIYIFINVLT